MELDLKKMTKSMALDYMSVGIARYINIVQDLKDEAHKNEKYDLEQGYNDKLNALLIQQEEIGDLAILVSLGIDKHK